MTYLSRTHLAWILLIPAALSSLRLTSYPDVATQGEGFTLSCVKDPSDLLEVDWIRESAKLFKTKSDSPEYIPLISENSASFRIVSGRISLSTSLTQHNLTLRINSTLDDGSVWECDAGTAISKKFTIQVMQHNTGVSTFQTTTMQSVQTSTSLDSLMDSTKDVQYSKPSQSTTGLSTEQNVNELFGFADDSKNVIYIVIGSVVGAVVVFIIIVTVVCVIRKRRNQTAQTKCPTPKEHSSVSEGEDGVDNSEMIENVLYCGYSDPQYNTDEENRSNADNKAQTSDETRVTDVYAQVQKKKNQTKVQVTVNIEDLYAKPVRKKSKDTANISVNNNVNINIGNIADESV